MWYSQGTWQFKSIRLLEATADKPVKHLAGDDIESFLWVLAWVVGRNASNDMSDAERSTFLEAFDQRSPGGSAKKDKIQAGGSAIRRLRLKNSQLETVLIQLWQHFGGRYDSDAFLEERTESMDKAQKWLQQLEEHSWMINKLRTALANDEWMKLTDCRVSHTISSKQTLTVGQKRRKSQMTDYGPTPLRKKVRKGGEAP